MANSPIAGAPNKSMTLEEARAVMWFKSYSRPIGELVDQGYITQDRLEWAAQNAYNLNIKQAASVILASMKQGLPTSLSKATAVQPSSTPLSALEIGMTIAQARDTRWPFKDFKSQPMGMLVDTKQLTLKDLGYAVENAWDEKVRQAASILMAVRLGQAVKEPRPSAGPLKVMSAGRSFAERRETLLTLIQGAIMGVALAVCGVWTLESVWRAFAGPKKPLPSMTPVLLIAVILVVAVSLGAIWLFGRFLEWGMDRLQKQVENNRRGQDGENRVVDAMRQSLDGNWTLFRNVTLPGRNKSDIDAVLVGPPGVWALEIKTFTGEYRNIGEQWEYHSGKGWKLHKPSVSRQARDNAVRLAEFFRVDSIRQWVDPAVIWADRVGPLTVQNPSVAVWKIDNLPEELGNLWQGKSIPESDRARIIEKLTRLSQKSEDE